MTALAGTTLDYQGAELTLFAHAVNWKRYFARQIRPYLGRTVVEVGAGLGGTTGLLHSGQAAWVCLEPDPAMAGDITAAITAGRLPPSCRVEIGIVADLLARGHEGRYDSVVYIDVLEHIENDRGELAAALRLLKPGGHLVVLSPAFSWLYTPFDRAVGHFRRYHRASLLGIGPAGARPVRVRYLDSVGLLASLANRLLLRSGMPTQSQVLTWDRLMVPFSRVVDPLVGHAFGRSLLAVWQK
ncbi:MAG: class I SAM-dependent methyltransferase [Magnetospirillum sp.]|nr:MAG: class I SAM-dependent methyltransferase [Magnetospirillum sp.]